MEVLTYSQVQETFPEAWEALPEPYKNDSCLTFYTDGEGLWAIYDLGGVYSFTPFGWRKSFARKILERVSDW